MNSRMRAKTVGAQPAWVSLMQRADLHYRAGRYAEAEKDCRKALKKAPRQAPVHDLLAVVLVGCGRLEEAEASGRRAVRLAPDSDRVRVNYAGVLKELGRTGEAEAQFRKALELCPRNVNAHISLALILIARGDFDEAVEHLQEVIRLKPDFVMAHFHLAHLKNRQSTDAEISAMKSLYQGGAVDLDGRFHLAFGLGAAFDKRGEHEQAFDYFQAGHRFKKALAPFSLAQYVRYIDELVETFTPDFIRRHANTCNPDETPLFIVGMPRSGTTLAEQILASHPGIAGAGECVWVEDLKRALSERGGGSFSAACRNLKAGEWRELGEAYLAKLEPKGCGVLRIVDTTPMNFLSVGFIAAMLPGARFVHCMRNPLDTCVSIFQQPLSDSHAYAHDLSDLGGFYRQYQRLMEHWENVVGERIHRLCYESLVSGGEIEIRRLLEFCGVPFDARCLSFHKTKRAINTPSVSQVRQPLYRGAVGRWKRYASRLGPLLEALGEASENG